MLCWLAVQLQEPFLGIGVTTKGPDSGPVLQRLSDFTKSDQHWYVKIDSRLYATQHKGQQGRLPWEVNSSKGRTVGCFVSENGEFHLCYGESGIDDVMGKGLPTDRPLWGFVALKKDWKVEANYTVAVTKGEAMVVYIGDKRFRVGLSCTELLHGQRYKVLKFSEVSVLQFSYCNFTIGYFTP